ncbi:hypothetical protein D3C73_1113470 [compost metagenome]
MPFVEMVDVDWNLQRTHGFDSANPKHNLLRNPLFPKPAVQLACNPGVAILGNIRIEQIQGIVAETVGFPYFADHINLADLNGNLHSSVLKEIVDIVVIGVVRIAACIDLLVRIALLPFETDGDDRSLYILGALDVVSGQNAQATGVHFEVGMQSVLHAEISY